MKILKGSLVETRYAWPTDENHPLETISTKAYHKNEVTYMSDKLGLHRISNPDPDNYAVSLHCKSPETSKTETSVGLQILKLLRTDFVVLHSKNHIDV
jgi:hypothetical protein